MQQIDKHGNRRFRNFAAEISHTPMNMKYYSDKKLLEQLSKVLHHPFLPCLPSQGMHMDGIFMHGSPGSLPKKTVFVHFF